MFDDGDSLDCGETVDEMDGGVDTGVDSTGDVDGCGDETGDDDDMGGDAQVDDDIAIVDPGIDEHIDDGERAIPIIDGGEMAGVGKILADGNTLNTGEHLSGLVNNSIR